MKIGKEFRPSPALKNIYFFQFFLIFLVGVLSWLIPTVIFAPAFISIPLLFIIVPIIALAIIWIPLYYRTIIYKLESNEIIWKRGVWFRNTGVVPYNRITNVDVKQGPVSRMFGIGSLHIQTAGYSGPNARGSEITIDGIENFDELQDVIIKTVRGRKPVAAETYDESDSTILKEVVRIRKLLENKKK